jgi:uncharacterized membrane protein
MPGRERLQGVLSSPFFDFAPWIVMSVIVGPERFVLAASLAFATALAIVLANRLVGVATKVLDFVGLAFFAALVVVGPFADDATRHWLERWSGDLSNALIVLIALGSIALGKPFTVQYAHERIDSKHWETPLFMRINYRVTWVWTGAFVITAVVGYLGDGPLGQPDNMWTNWVVQIAALILALRFTEWYPEMAHARDEIARGERSEPAPTVRELLLPLTGYLVPVGVLVLLIDTAPWWVGVGLIASGVALTRLLAEQEAEIESGVAVR